MRALLPLLLLGSGCAVGPQDAPPHPPADPNHAEWRIRIDTMDHGIGAYTISIRWNPNVAAISEIVPCSPRDFRGTPEYDPATFPTGQTRIASLDVLGSSPKSGPWHLFTVIFRRVGPGTLSAKAEIDKLYDDQNKPFAGRVVNPEFRTLFP
jgi:hypothetical protein